MKRMANVKLLLLLPLLSVPLLSLPATADVDDTGDSVEQQLAVLGKGGKKKSADESGKAESKDAGDESAGKKDDEDDDSAPETTEHTVLEAIEINVTNGSDDPIKSATITVTATQPKYSSTKITGSDGAAKFKDVPAGKVNIKVTANGYQPHTLGHAIEVDDKSLAITLEKRS